MFVVGRTSREHRGILRGVVLITIAHGNCQPEALGADRRGLPSAANTGQTAGTEVLADRLRDVSRMLEHQNDSAETLAAIVRSAVGTVPGCAHASISATVGKHVMTLAASDRLARAVDAAQYETGEGPCLETLFDQETFRLSDMTAERRWPAFARRARALGVHSMLSVQLFVEGDELGVLNLHGDHVDAFSDESEHVALLFAAHAAVAMARSQERHRLRRALSTREVIGQAQGILMERFRVTRDRAFQILVHASQTANVKLIDVAVDPTTTGELPRPADRPATDGSNRATG